jgi:hypothetical protein
MDRHSFNDGQVAAIRNRVAQDFDRYTRRLRRLEKRRFPADDVFLLCLRRVKR